MKRVQSSATATATATTTMRNTTTKKMKTKTKTKPDNEAMPSWDAIFQKRPKKQHYDTRLFEGIVELEPSPHLKLVCWNVNSLRALMKKDPTYLETYLHCENPDILCLSEIKCNEPVDAVLEILTSQHLTTTREWRFSQTKKGYAGTAVFSKLTPLQIDKDVMQDQEGRYIGIEFDTFWLVHTYVPNAGQTLQRLAYRVDQWDPALRQHLRALQRHKPVIWCGDLNVAHHAIDLHDPQGNRRSAGFTTEERESFSTTLTQLDLVDVFRHLHPSTVQYTYWSYRASARAKNKGWRLDYFIVSRALLSQVVRTFVRTNVRGSDHCPIGLELLRGSGRLSLKEENVDTKTF